MKFYPEQLFHIYNQGNNRRQIFFSAENYEFFLWKMRAYLLPFGDVIAWCLMPNHFHWQFYVKQPSIDRKTFLENVDQVEYTRRKKKYGSNARQVNRSWSRKTGETGEVELNAAIGILEQAYTQAINKEKGWTGSLFRKPCKAKDGWIEELTTPSNSNPELDCRFLPGTDYAHQCFCYIHDNPKKAGLVKDSLKWEYSSARDYAGLRNGTLCNVAFGKRLMDLD